MANETGYTGQQDPGEGASDWGAVTAIARRLMAEIQTTKLVRVVAVRNDGALAQAGFIDVQPMVNQIDGAGNQTPHGIIYNVPYLRMQGGTNAVIMDPIKDDIGYCGFCTHDISTVKATRSISNPASRRRFDYADAVYIGGVLNGVPEQYIRFSADGIEMVSPTKIRGAAPVIEFTATDSLSITAPDVGITASSSATVSSPDIELDGNTANSGTMDIAGTVHMEGNATVDGSLMNQGKNVGAPHKHQTISVGSPTSAVL